MTRPEQRTEATIRRSGITDFKTIMELVKEYYRYDALDFDANSIGTALRKLLQDENLGCAWIVEQATEAAGYLLLTFNYDLEFGGDEGLITDLFLREKFRGRGIGRRLIEFVEAYCRGRGITTVELQVESENRAAQAFYRRLGFTRLPRLVMSKRIPVKA
jgi:ribosomal protein S18 acetylase RimI-like enzyme